MYSTAKVLKVSDSGKSIFVRATNPSNPFDTNGIAGYCANPEGKYKVGDEIKDFPQPKGITTRADSDGVILQTKDNVPLSFLVW